MMDFAPYYARAEKLQTKLLEKLQKSLEELKNRPKILPSFCPYNWVNQFYHFFRKGQTT